MKYLINVYCTWTQKVSNISLTMEQLKHSTCLLTYLISWLILDSSLEQQLVFVLVCYFSILSIMVHHGIMFNWCWLFRNQIQQVHRTITNKIQRRFQFQTSLYSEEIHTMCNLDRKKSQVRLLTKICKIFEFPSECCFILKLIN